MKVHRQAPVDNAIENWNPAWGPKPERQRPPTPPQTHPRYHVHRIACPNGCNEPVDTLGPKGVVYECVVCGARMVVSRVAADPKPRATSIHPGERYGRLVIQALDRGRPGLRAVVVCDCGTTKIVWAKSLRSGQTRSCGCLARDLRDEHPWRYSYKTRGST